MKWAAFTIGTALALAVAIAVPARAETIHLSGIAPAASDEAAAQRSIAVERFGGEDGPRLAFQIESRLRDAYVTPQPWFTVLDPDLAGDADAVLEGFADPRFSESEYVEQRETCITRAQDGACTATGMVEARCLRVSATLRPELRLVAHDGRLLWTAQPYRAQDFGWCPEFDNQPQIDPVIDSWLDSTANEVRNALAPWGWARNVRIMERSSGLPRDARTAFRNAIRLTERDPDGACRAFARLLEANPTQPSLTFNAGLCAEHQGDLATAELHYRAALAYRTSDDEGRNGLARLGQRHRAARQLASRFP